MFFDLLFSHEDMANPDKSTSAIDIKPKSPNPGELSLQGWIDIHKSNQRHSTVLCNSLLYDLYCDTLAGIDTNPNFLYTLLNN